LPSISSICSIEGFECSSAIALFQPSPGVESMYGCLA
jgi:hypothetical protein